MTPSSVDKALAGIGITLLVGTLAGADCEAHASGASPAPAATTAEVATPASPAPPAVPAAPAKPEKPAKAEKPARPEKPAKPAGKPSQEAKMDAKIEEKLDSQLAGLMKAYEKGADKSFAAYADKHLLETVEGRVRVELLATSEAAVPALKQAIEKAGGVIETDLENHVYCLLPAKAIGSLAAREDVWTMSAALRSAAPMGGVKK